MQTRETRLRIDWKDTWARFISRGYKYFLIPGFPLGIYITISHLPSSKQVPHHVHHVAIYRSSDFDTIRYWGCARLKCMRGWRKLNECPSHRQLRVLGKCDHPVTDL